MIHSPPTGADSPSAERFHLRLSAVWGAAAVLVPAIAIAAVPLQAIDLAYSLRAGAQILDTGAVPRVDTFTLPAAGLPWFDQQWGAQALLAFAHRAGGWLALAALRSGLVLAVGLLVFLACRRHLGSARSSAALTLGGSAFFLGGAALRPQLLGLACFGLVLWATAERHHRPNLPWLVVPVTALWANLHGSFVLGPAWLLLAALRDRAAGRRGALRMASVGLLAAAAAALNPHGVRVYGYVRDLSTDPLIRRLIREWQPPSLRPGDGARFVLGLAFAASVAFVLVALARSASRPRWPAVLGAVAFAAPGALSTRGIYWWGMAAPVLLAEVGVGRPTREREDPAGLHATVIVGALVIALVAVLGRWTPYAGPEPPPGSMLTFAPQRLTQELRTILRPGEPLFNAQLWGSWFELALPEHPVFADSRIEVIPASAWRDYLDVSAAAPGWEETLGRWGIRVLAIRDDQQGPLIDALTGAPGWSLAFRGEGGAVFVRSEG